MENSELPAFPLEAEQSDNYGTKYRDVVSWGLTKREYFAAMAMQGIMNGVTSEPIAATIAKWSIMAADELLKQLEIKKATT